MTYAAAISFCKGKNSSLIEIDSIDQKNFIFDKLKKISGEVEWQTPERRKYKAWWGGATDEKQEGNWRWTQSGGPVQDYMWGDKEPNNQGNDENVFCFFKAIQVMSNYDDGPYHGNDCSGISRMGYPVCQQRYLLLPSCKTKLLQYFILEVNPDLSLPMIHQPSSSFQR